MSGAAHATQDRRGHGRFRTRLTRQDGHNDRGDQAQDGTNDGAEEQEGQVDGGIYGCLRAGLRVSGGARERA